MDITGARWSVNGADAVLKLRALRAVLAGTATGTPKHGDDYVEMIRILKLTRNSAVKSQTQATNQVRAVLVTAPPQLREALQHLARVALLQRCAALRVGELITPLAAAKHALRLLARRALALRAEAKALRAHLTELTAAACPALVELTGIGPDSAAALLISAGDNPQQLRSEAAFAALCGINPASLPLHFACTRQREGARTQPKRLATSRLTNIGASTRSARHSSRP